MSYILDALKKIEHEKNMKARSDGRVSISGDLFQERKQPAAKTGIWKALILITLASLVTFAGTWFVLQGDGTKSVPGIRPTVAPRPAPVNPPVVTPVLPVPAQSQVNPVVVPPAAPLPIETKSRETAALDESSVRKVRSTNTPVKARAPSPALPVQTVQAPADIKLSGIAWQDERTARRAVVNGFLLKEGAVVAGAKISDIQADRVRFSSSAGIFEIRLDSVLPAGGQR